MLLQVVTELVESCRSHDFTDLVMVHEHRGEPDGLVVCHLPYGPTAYFGIFNTVLRHDIGDKKQVGGCVGGWEGLEGTAGGSGSALVCARGPALVCWVSIQLCQQRRLRPGCCLKPPSPPWLPPSPTPPCPSPANSRQVGTISEAYPHLIFDRFTSKLGTRVSGVYQG